MKFYRCCGYIKNVIVINICPFCVNSYVEIEMQEYLRLLYIMQTYTQVVYICLGLQTESKLVAFLINMYKIAFSRPIYSTYNQHLVLFALPTFQLNCLNHELKSDKSQSKLMSGQLSFLIAYFSQRFVHNMPYLLLHNIVLTIKCLNYAVSQY